MKNWKVIPLFACLMLFLSTTAFASGTVSVTLTTPDGTPSEKIVICPENASLWYAAYTASGKMLEAGRASVQNGKTAITLSQDAQTVKAFALDGDFMPLSPVALLKGGSLYEQGKELLASGDYAGAIVAFTDAISADDNAPLSYVGRGDAYIALGEVMENLAAAQADYEAALALEKTLAEAYLGVADVYIRQAEYEQAKSILQDALGKALETDAIQEKIQEIESGNIQDSSGNDRRMSTYDENHILIWWHDYEYDEQGRQSSVTAYDGDGNQIGRVDLEYDANGNELVDYGYYGDGTLGRIVNEYDERGNCVKENWYDSDGTWESQTIYQYNEQNQCIRWDEYRTINNSTDMELEQYWIYEYDKEGREIKVNIYSSEEKLTGYQTRAYDENGRELEYCGYSIEEGVTSLSWREVYEYDGAGKRIRAIEYDGDGNIKRTTEYN